MSSQLILEVIGLSKSFGGVKAVDGVSFKVRKGEVFGIIGPNGSGKTTLINTITGFVKPDKGKVIFKGVDITGKPPHEIAGMGIARTFQTARPFLRLPAYKNPVVPLYSSRARKMFLGRYGDRDHVALDLLEEVGFERDSLTPYKPAGTLPHGYLKRLELARCLALKPEVIITDEVFSGLSAAEVASIMPLLEKLNMSGITLIMIEHRLRELFRLAERVMVLEYGVKIAEGTPSEVVGNERVKEAYMGTEVM
ncbi:MAG: ABC transporter ATP-binding protein [Candidatus Nezhaarchaeales archaeon]